jgi:sortase A
MRALRALCCALACAAFLAPSVRAVDPDDVYVLDPTDQPTLTLVTCYPFEFIGHAPRRFIVRAELVSQEKRSAL